MFATAVRYFSRRTNPPLREQDLRLPLEQIWPTCNSVLDIIRKEGPFNVPSMWDRVKDAGIAGVNSKTQMKRILKWLKEQQKIRMVCTGTGKGNTKQFICCLFETDPQRALDAFIKQATKGSKPPQKA